MTAVFFCFYYKIRINVKTIYITGGGCVDGRNIVEYACKKGASDIHISDFVYLRVNGELEKTEWNKEKALGFIIESFVDQNSKEILEKTGEVDIGAGISDTRLRINLFRQRIGISASIRIIPSVIKDRKHLGIPDVIYELTECRNGIILVTGATGSGKSTTLASIIDYINSNMKKHIITLEDPIEYIHKNKRSIITQREIGKDTIDYKSGLRSALRQDPDIIMIGEMRDSETMKTAIYASETGHLVFSTLHTGNASKTVERIVDSCEGMRGIRDAIASQLRAVISQKLIKSSYGRSAVFEIMKNIPAIENMIREGNTSSIENAIKTGKRYKMQSFREDIERLYRKGIISEEIYRAESEVLR